MPVRNLNFLLSGLCSYLGFVCRGPLALNASSFLNFIEVIVKVFSVWILMLFPFLSLFCLFYTNFLGPQVFIKFLTDLSLKQKQILVISFLILGLILILNYFLQCNEKLEFDLGLREATKGLEETVSELRESLLKTDYQLKNLGLESLSIRDTTKELEKTISNLKKSLEKTNDQLGISKLENLGIRQVIKGLEKTVSESKDLLEKTTYELRTSELESNELGLLVTGLELKVQNLESQKQELEKKILDLEGAVSELKVELKDASLALGTKSRSRKK